jgi:RNA polymerase sigma factor (sigma-70 family)
MESEAELIARAKKDPLAFGEIFDAHYDRIFGYCMKRTGSADIAADIAAETFVKAMRGMPLFRWRGIPIAAWLYRIAGNELNMYFRKGKYAPVSLSLLIEEGFDPRAEALESEKHLFEKMLQEDAETKKVYAALRALPAKYQEVIALRFFEDKSTPEIAQILGKREGTVRSLLSRGLTQLREQCDNLQQNGDARNKEENTSPLHVIPKKI